MEQPQLIDLATWPRREHFEHYRRDVPCTYAVTVELDCTAFVEQLAQSPRKTYIAQIWALATVVNRHDEFRLSRTDTGAPAIWERADPAFTVFNPERETFACVWAPYDPDFGAFHEVAARLLVEHRQAAAFFPQGPPPPNCFDVSSLPWASFTGFNLNLRDGWDRLAPIFTVGRYTQRAGRTQLPVAIQIHQAAADGFHVSRFVNELQELMSEPHWVD